MTPFRRRVRDAILSLGPGEVATYGEIAEEAGSPGAAQAVGGVLAASEGLSWWRVVGSGGHLISPNAEEQARRLREEGVGVEGGRVLQMGQASS